MNESSFLWIGVISANYKESGKASPLAEYFIHLHKACGNILYSKILKKISLPDDFVSSNREIKWGIEMKKG